MTRFAAAILLLFLAGPAWCQDVPLDVKGGGVKVVSVNRQVVVKVDVTLVSSFPFTVNAPAGAGLYFWQVPPGVTSLDRNDRLEITAAPKGEMVVGVKMITADLDAAGKFKGFVTKFGSVTFTVGDVPEPKPPDPKPPIPPEPKPPVPVSGLKVLIIYESADLTKMPSGQQSIMFGKTTRDRLDTMTQAGPDGKTKEWRIWDKDAVLDNVAPHWKTMMTRPRTSVPWVVMTDGAGTVIHEGPLPNDVTAFSVLLDRFAPKVLKKAG